MDFLRRFDLNGKKKGWKISFFIFLVMLLLGSFQELEAIQMNDIKPVSETGQRYLMLLFCFSLLLIYFIPFCIFEKDRKKGILFMLAVFVNHALWDCPFAENMGVQALLGAVVLFVFFFEYVKVMQKDAVEMVNPHDEMNPLF